jgi:hypothetical protein
MPIQVWGLEFITLEASGREIYFLIDVYYVKFNVKKLKLILKILQTWSEEIKEIGESWLDIHKIEEKTI